MNVFQDLQESRIYKNEEALSTEFLPDFLPHRDTQIQEIARNLNPATNGRKPQNTFIVGSPGIGKTCVTKFVFRELQNFADEKVEEFIKDYVARLKSSEFDNLLVYKKRLSKPVDEYIKTVPPHVKAAKLLLEKNPKLFIKDVSYLMTFRGPVPEEFSPTDIDYQHYIDKQIAPLATDVLKFLNLSFDDIISGSQMSLF